MNAMEKDWDGKMWFPAARHCGSGKGCSEGNDVLSGVTSQASKLTPTVFGNFNCAKPSKPSSELWGGGLITAATEKQIIIEGLGR